jgi:hypothetical protein
MYFKQRKLVVDDSISQNINKKELSQQQQDLLFVCAGTLDDYQDLKFTREVFVDACPKAYALENKTKDRQVLTRAEYDA